MTNPDTGKRVYHGHDTIPADAHDKAWQSSTDAERMQALYEGSTATAAGHTLSRENCPACPRVNAEPVNKFADDMSAAGFAPEAYGGRMYWFGPAVPVDDVSELQAVIRATTEPVQWDSLGLGYIVYPQMSDQAWYDANKSKRTCYMCGGQLDESLFAYGVHPSCEGDDESSDDDVETLATVALIDNQDNGDW